MPPRAVFFDIGGVLALSPPTGWESRWETKLGLSTGELDRRLETLWQTGMVGATKEEDVPGEVGRRLGLKAPEVEAMLVDAWDEYLGRPNVEIIRYFESLRARCRTAIISNSFVGAREREQARYGFAGLCEDIVYSHEVGIAKPDRRIYELACERLEISPAESVFVDDLDENITAAAALGMRAVRFVDNEQTIREVELALGG